METSKHKIRERVLKLINQQPRDEQQAKSRVIFEKLFALPTFVSAKTVLFYASCPGEVQTFDMIKAARKLGKIIGLPKICKDRKAFLPVVITDMEKDLVSGAYNIPEPRTFSPVMETSDLDMVIVPGVAFDRTNHRIGRGGGYYDRFLSALPASVFSVGLAYDFQLIDHIPSLESHDVAVSCVLSN